ncbi:hypothetical protein RUM44_005039 [Polyplax serrata]|uniref:Tetraspanin n=1 Tax=Polyplax serrata TaxID=468196 RepID=A0ABR1AWT1_POLSC
MVKNRRHESECCNVLFLKYVLHIFNVIFVAAGISVLAVGIWSVIEKHKYVSLLTSVTYPMTSYTLIAAGCLVLAIAVIGSCGVAKENRCLLLIRIICVALEIDSTAPIDQNTKATRLSV